MARGELNDSGGIRTAKRRTMSGTFDEAGATQAFDLLAEEKLYGSLTISDGLKDLCCFFTRGGLRVIASGRELPPLVRRLVLEGMLTEDDARRVARAKAEGGKEARDEREILIQTLAMRPVDVDGVVSSILEDVIMDCMFWEDPQYEVSTGEPNIEMMQRRDLSALTLSIGVPSLIDAVKARVRSVSEIRRTVSSLQVIAEPTGKGRQAAEAGAPLGDGRHGRMRLRFLRTVVQEPGLAAPVLGQRLKIGELEVASRLHELSTRGYLTVTRQPRTREQEMARIREMEEAIDQALNQLLRRMRLADNSAASGDTTRAARHMARAGGILMQEGRTDEAVRTFGKALKHSDEDLEAREGYVQGLWATNRQAEAARESQELGKRYLGLNLPRRARRVLERALGYEESTPTLTLFVDSLVKLKRGAAAAEAGQRLINRLKREGRADEAREVAGDLMSLSSAEDRKRLARAAGADRRAVGVLVLIGLALGGAYFPLSARVETLSSYQSVASQVRTSLGGVTTIKGLHKTIDEAKAALEPFAEDESRVGVAAKQALRQLAQLQADAQLAQPIVPMLPWKETSDIEHLSHTLKELSASVQTEALSQPLAKLRDELEAFRKSFEAQRVQLSSLEGPEALAHARKMREEFSGLPTALEQSVVRVRISSQPPGAQVTVDGVEYSKRTPEAVLNLPLRGKVKIQLSLRDHETQNREVTLDDLEDEPELHFQLPRTTPVAPSPTPRPTRTPRPRPTRSPKPTPTVRVRPTKTPVRNNTWPHFVMNKEAIARGKPREGYSIEFVQEPNFFSEISVSPRYRVLVQPINEADGTKVFLTGLRLTLYVRRHRGWKAEKPLELSLDERYPRLVTLHPGQKLRVGNLSATVHLDEEDVRDLAEDGIERLIRDLKRRERK